MKLRAVIGSCLLAVVGVASIASAAQARVREDYTVSGTVKVNYPAGVQVYYTPAFGAFGLTNCTRDETSTDFKLTKRDEERRFEFVAKNTGSCAFEASYQVWKFVVAKTPGGPAIAAGAWELGQQRPGESYFVDCSSTHGLPWHDFRCTKTGTTSIEVSPP